MAGFPRVQAREEVKQQMDTETERVVAVLHDVVEDTAYDLDDIEDEFGSEVRNAVDAVTKRDGEAYEDLIDRAASNPIARAVKIADLEDNMDITRLDSVDEDLGERLEKYHRSWERLTTTE